MNLAGFAGWQTAWSEHWWPAGEPLCTGFFSTLLGRAARTGESGTEASPSSKPGAWNMIARARPPQGYPDPVMSTPTTWLTADAYRKLQHEYDSLTTDGRHRIADRLAEARAHGDIRENADYDAAKTEQGLMEARIRKLRHLLDNAVVGDTDNDQDDDGTVRIGSVVTLRDEYGDEEYFVAIPENKVPGYLLASPAGPLGTALIGASVGDEVSYEAPGGTFTVKVIAVRPYGG